MQTSRVSSGLFGFLWDADMILHEASSTPYHTHTWYKELEELPKDIKDKLFVVHCPPDMHTSLKKLESGRIYEI